MNLHLTEIRLAPRARRTDPATSHTAAANARTGRAQALRERILQALQDHGAMTARELSDALAEDFYAVSRRLSEVPGIFRTGAVRDGCAVWATAEPCYFVEMGEADRLRLQGK